MIKKNNQIRKFIFIKNKDKQSLFIWDFQTNKKTNVKLDKKSNYIVGYTLKSTNNDFDGEYIKLNINKNKLSIINDTYASYNLYHYRDNSIDIFSTSIDEIFKVKFVKKTVILSRLYKYFGFGYIPASQEIIFKNFKIIEGNSEIKINNNVLINRTNYDLFSKNKTNFASLYKSLINSVKLKLYKKKKIIFCLTGGLDTLLGTFAIKTLKLNYPIATWGEKNSDDITRSKLRKDKFFNNSKHIKFIIQRKKIPIYELKKYAKSVGGLANLSAINLQLFTNYLLNSNYTNHIYCDHFEVTRKNFKKIDELFDRYQTPEAVIKKNIKLYKKYKKILNVTRKEIKRRYKKNIGEKFYFYDRYIKGTAARNHIVSLGGCIKTTLGIEKNFINLNSNYNSSSRNVSYHNFFRKKLEYKEELQFSSMLIKNNKNKKMPFDNNYLIKNFKNYFITELKKMLKTKLSNYFNIKKIIMNINKMKFIENEQWFILRFMCLIIFLNSLKQVNFEED